MAIMNSTKAINNGGSLKAEAGLWIDHREAFIVVLSKTGEETKRIQSNAETATPAFRRAFHWPI